MNILDIAPERFSAIYNSLDPVEQGTLTQILQEFSETGESETYNTVWLQDYEEIPVDIDTFLENDEYLGKATNHGNQIYPFWRNAFREIFSNGDTSYHEIVLSGAIGIGKTAIAVYAISYLLYRLLCLKRPQRYFGFADSDDIAIFFFNATVALAEGVGYKRLHACCLQSPWFMEHGKRLGSSSNPYYAPDKHVVIRAGSKGQHGLGQQIFVGMLDECNFVPGSNATVEKSKIMQTYASVSARIKSRFIKNGKLLGKMFLVSSKKAEHDFLEVYIHEHENDVKNGLMYLVDRPLWEVKPSTTYSGIKFPVAYGSKQLTPKVVEDGEDIEALKQMGYNILMVPIEFKRDFEFNIITSLQDLAGIALPGSLSYFSYKIFSKCYCDRPNPFTNEILEIGIDDPMEYYQFFNPELIPKAFFDLPMAIHVDTSLKSDNTGITGACYVKNIMSDSDDGTVEKRVYAQVFSVGIHAPQGSEISMAKTRRFIYYLRKIGFHIVMISTDTFQSAEFHQILQDKGFTTQIKSLDRTPEGYHILREAMVEDRIELIKHNKIEEELIHLQRDTNTGKLDHPANGCFTGDTKIRLVDGRSLSILELMEEQEYRQNWVYTVNEATGEIEPKPIRKVFQTKITKDLLKVTLDDGSVIICTPEHRFMLRDGSYEEIQNLEPGTSLMPLYTRIRDNYRMYYDIVRECWRYEYHEFCSEPEEESTIVHHLNFNKNDNTPTNLKRVTKSQHRTIHNLATNPYDKVSEGVRKWHARTKDTPEYAARSEKLRQKAYDYCRKVNPNYIPCCEIVRARRKAIEERFGVVYDELTDSEKNALGNKYSREQDPTIVARMSATLSQRHAEGKFENAKKALADRVWYTDGIDSIYIKKDAPVPEGYHRGRTFKNSHPRKNHKILSIERIVQPWRVYDLEIQDNHKVALDAGVFVHNSKDISDSLAGAIWDLSLLPYDPGLSDFHFRTQDDVDDMLPVMRQGLFHGLQEYNPYKFDRI